MKRHDLLEQTRQVALLTSLNVKMTIPSILAEGEEFTLRISVTGPDTLPYDGFTNRIKFEECQGVEGLPESFALSQGEWSAEITGLKAVGPNVAVIRARIEDTAYHPGDPIITSNPAWIFKDPPYRLYWGDIHVHTKFSSCGAWRSKDPEWCYVHARDISFLDFAGIADHLRGIASEEHRWPRTQELAQKYHEPGRFVPILGFESSHAKDYGGDNNAYYLHDNAPYFWLGDREDMSKVAPEIHLKELWKFLDGQKSPYITIPHHTGRAWKNRTFEEDYYDPEREPLFEIFSSWGSSENRWNCFPISGGNNDDPAYFVDSLKAGCRYGVIASSDDHATLPGSGNNHWGMPFGISPICGNSHKGLAAIRAPELTREALFGSMQKRNTYATTLVRSLVDIQIGDASMGQEIRVESGDSLRKKRRITVKLTLDQCRSADLSLVRNGEDIAHKKIKTDAGSAVNEIVFEDNDDLETVAVRNAKFHPESYVVYYVRILGNGASCQWTSPIWLDI